MPDTLSKQPYWGWFYWENGGSNLGIAENKIQWDKWLSEQGRWYDPAKSLPP